MKRRRNRKLLTCATGGSRLVVAAQEIDGLVYMILFAVGTLGLYLAEVDSVSHVMAAVLAIPALRDIRPLVELLAVAIEDISVELDDALVVTLGFKDVVLSVSVGREGVGNMKYRLASLDGKRLFHLVLYRIRAVDKSDSQRDI